MEPTFRQSLNWLHTWAGVVIGPLLFLVFWTGTVCVFDKEIDRWMIPQTRLIYDGTPVSADRLLAEQRKLPPRQAPWAMVMPNERDPFAWIAYRTPTGFDRKFYDPVGLKLLPDAETWAATRFFFPLHYSLHINAWDIGLWLVGLAGMAMLALCISGVIIHRKIFADFFTLRRSRQPQRALLDLHNTAGTLGFVFYVAMAFSGLAIFAATYYPSGWMAGFKGSQQAYFTEAYDNYFRPPQKKPAASVASLDAMVDTATKAWDGLPPFMVRIWLDGDAGAFVEVRPSIEGDLAMRTDPFYFDAATGALLHRSTTRPVTGLQQYLVGLHFVQFRHWTLRWVYFALGLLGSLLIATGFLFWGESRRKAHEAAGLGSVRFVEGLAAGSTAGLVVATLAFFVANRLLPSGATFLGGARYELEIWVFFAAWLATFAHGWLRRGQAWIELCWIAAALAAAAVLLNALTTGDHLARTVAQGQWAVAGMDLVLLAGAAAAAVTAFRLQRRKVAYKNGRLVRLGHEGVSS
jgi:uncharacterized iron-regulated membrane protein